MTNLDPMFRGDTPIWRTIVTNKADGSPFDLTGWTVRFTAKRNKTDPDSAAVFRLSSVDGTCTFPDGEIAGVIYSQPERESTEALTADVNAYWDIQISRDGPTNQTYTIDWGTLPIKIDITRTAP